MKVVILAGGFGTRIAEETHLKPKPMIEIGGKPILWHIMKIYSYYGFNEFIICCGYKGYLIKEYFSNYSLHNSNVTFDYLNGTMDIHNKFTEPWKVTLIDTGLNTMTGGRLLRIKEYLKGDYFCFTYGDGLSNINIKDLIRNHKESEAKLTVSAVQAPGRYGSLNIKKNIVKSFEEKPLGDGAWINGGFFVCNYSVLDYIRDDQTIWEKSPLETLAKENKLNAFLHSGFWQPMDTLRDKNELEKLWKSGNAPWRVW